MPHLKCVSCKTRHFRGNSMDPVSVLCPGCNYPLEPVGALTEVVGFQRLTDPVVADAGTWDDDGGAPIAGAVSLPRPAAFE